MHFVTLISRLKTTEFPVMSNQHMKVHKRSVNPNSTQVSVSPLSILWNARGQKFDARTLLSTQGSYFLASFQLNRPFNPNSYAWLVFDPVSMVAFKVCSVSWLVAGSLKTEEFAARAKSRMSKRFKPRWSSNEQQRVEAPDCFGWRQSEEIDLFQLTR